VAVLCWAFFVEPRTRSGGIAERISIGNPTQAAAIREASRMAERTVYRALSE
jgi:hypothetical protein